MLLKRVLPLFAVLALLGAACGDDEPATETGAASGEHNEADVAFAKAMVPHHEQAVAMAGLAKSRASSADVKDLAARIEAAQGPEITTMQGWLAEWGEEAPGDHRDMGTDMGGGMDMEMSGMMSDEEMGMLEGASGADFDRMFLEMMIRHHEGAVEMAETEREQGVYEPATQLAEDIASAQKEEIDEMQGLLAGLQ